MPSSTSACLARAVAWTLASSTIGGGDAEEEFRGEPGAGDVEGDAGRIDDVEVVAEGLDRVVAEGDGAWNGATPNVIARAAAAMAVVRYFMVGDLPSVGRLRRAPLVLVGGPPPCACRPQLVTGKDEPACLTVCGGL
jgi:hypothetical protein